jgi:hypothetical protein
MVFDVFSFSLLRTAAQFFLFSFFFYLFSPFRAFFLLAGVAAAYFTSPFFPPSAALDAVSRLVVTCDKLTS